MGKLLHREWKKGSKWSHWTAACPCQHASWEPDIMSFENTVEGHPVFCSLRHTVTQWYHGASASSIVIISFYWWWKFRKFVSWIVTDMLTCSSSGCTMSKGKSMIMLTGMISMKKRKRPQFIVNNTFRSHPQVEPQIKLQKKQQCFHGNTWPVVSKAPPGPNTHSHLLSTLLLTKQTGLMPDQLLILHWFGD